MKEGQITGGGMQAMLAVMSPEEQLARFASKMRQLMAHGDEITMAAHTGKLAKVISFRVTHGGTIETRWTGFENMAELYGVLQLGANLVQEQMEDAGTS